MNATILVTGAAGFIGSHLAQRLAGLGHTVVGIDNLNNYYDVELKQKRLERLRSLPGFVFEKVELADQQDLNSVFSRHEIKHVIHLAAQAGVRYSLENPHAYTNSNLVGFMNMLESCRHNRIERLMYASSSSVYGAVEAHAVTEVDSTDRPLSLYAATKKANEVMAHSYGHMFGLRTVGLRFFSVYGPWGRPDMAMFKFAKAISNGQPIDVYNFGKMKRDFTYIDDTVSAVVSIFDRAVDGNAEQPLAKIYNVARGEPVELLYLIKLIEEQLGRKANMNMLPMQRGDVTETNADITALQQDYQFSPEISIEEGVKRFIEWFQWYHA